LNKNFQKLYDKLTPEQKNKVEDLLAESLREIVQAEEAVNKDEREKCIERMREFINAQSKKE
jgi:TRAP-type C4-dicarboxylate transport system substrate-binding protein